MKSTTSLILISLLSLSLFSSSISIRPSLLPITPKAQDLTDHFGTEPIQNIYGPHHNNVVDLAREGVTPGTIIQPIKNFAKEINPSQVAGGDLTNTAYDSTKIIKPTYAQPKLDINSQIVHDAVINTPVQLGTQINEKSVVTQDRVTGKIDTAKVHTKTPIVGMMKNLRQVTTDQRTLVNMTNGKTIDLTKKIGYFGKE